VSYNLDLTDLAEATLGLLVETRFPQADQNTAYDIIDQHLVELADNPIQRLVRGPHGRPTAIGSVEVGGTLVLWGVTLYFGQDERTLVLTKFFELRQVS